MATTEEGIATQGGVGLKMPTDLGWSTPVAMQERNVVDQAKHIEDNAPKALAIMQAAKPDATPEQRVAGADAFKAYSGPGNNQDFAGSHDIRWEKVFGAPNIGAAITGLTGGSDVREHGRNGSGIPVVTVYNSRGDLRRYEWQDGTRISPEELKQLGPVASIRDVSAERHAVYKAQGVNAATVMQVQAKDWASNLATAKVGLTEGDAGIEINDRIKNIAKQLKLAGKDVGPADRAFMAQVNSVTANRSQQISYLRDALHSLQKGTGNKDMFDNLVGQFNGLNSQIQFTQNKKLTVGQNKEATEQDINEIADKFGSTNASSAQVTAKLENLMNAAQSGKLGELKYFDLLSEMVGLKAQAAKIQDTLDQNGGVPGFKGAPNVNHATTDSFSLAYINGEYGAAQAKAAKLWAQHVIDTNKARNGAPPDIGDLESRFLGDNSVKSIRKERTDNSLKFLKEAEQIDKQTNAETVSPTLTRMVAGAPVEPPKLPKPEAGSPVNTAPAGSKPPSKEQPSGGFDLNSIIPIKKRK